MCQILISRCDSFQSIEEEDEDEKERQAKVSFGKRNYKACCCPRSSRNLLKASVLTKSTVLYTVCDSRAAVDKLLTEPNCESEVRVSLLL